MARRSNQFQCTNCGAVSASWSGRCFVCGEWNTLQKQLGTSSDASGSVGREVKEFPIGDTQLRGLGRRISSGVKVVDDVLGGGFVQGSVVLIAGQPGIGKSTLLLQLANSAAKTHNVLYVSGEESVQQVGLRAKRLGANSKKLKLATSTSADDIAATILNDQNSLVIIDSIQTVSVDSVGSAPGTVSQITNSAHVLTTAAKQTGTGLVLVGHVTKEGTIAGPKVLEHVVDVVMQLEGDRYGGFKILRGVKNRYGATNEVAIFEMLDNGMQPVDNPSAALLAERQVSDGSIVLATMEGARPVLVEVQALVNRTNYGYPKRAASGLDLNRVNLLVAVLERRTKLNLGDQDIYVNIVGGIRIGEPAADLAVCMAIASATKGMQLKKDAVVFGEVGLSGEVRHVPHIDKRLAEAKKLGFSLAVGPQNNGGKKLSGLREVNDVRTALNQFLEKD